MKRKTISELNEMKKHQLIKLAGDYGMLIKTLEKGVDEIRKQAEELKKDIEKRNA